MSLRAAQRYQEMDIRSMSPAHLVVCLYSVLLTRLHRAKLALANDDSEMRNRSIMKAQDVVEELIVALDREAGGALAGNLAALYSYFSTELSTIDMTSDAPRLQRLIDMVTPLHEAWTRAADTVGASCASTVPHDA